jgi:hypothetical protein
MNKHIELVKKWLAAPESVTFEELADNIEPARTAADAAEYAVRATRNADDAAWYAAYAAAEAAAYAAETAHWVERYEEMINE